MRVTGGQARGRRIETVKGFKIRPTSDRVREAVFNLLGQDLSGLGVLDLFSGTGSLAIESLSRGASHAVLIDKSQQAVNLMQKNLRQTGFESRGVVVRGPDVGSSSNRPTWGMEDSALYFLIRRTG